MEQRVQTAEAMKIEEAVKAITEGYHVVRLDYGGKVSTKNDAVRLHVTSELPAALVYHDGSAVFVNLGKILRDPKSKTYHEDFDLDEKINWRSETGIETARNLLKIHLG